MAWLKVYDWERETYPEFRGVKLCSHDQHLIIKKLTRHFKIPITPTIINSKWRKRGGGAYFASQSKIVVPIESDLGTICHEFAHHLQAIKNGGKTDHSKKFKRELKKVYTFAKRYLPKVEEVKVGEEKGSEFV